MSAIRLFLDEDVWSGLAVALHEYGFDVVHAYDVERGGMADADQRNSTHAFTVAQTLSVGKSVFVQDGSDA